MTLRLPLNLLDRPAREGARRLATLRLRALERARPRLDDPADTDALHDFRVALRRLRSVLRAYRGALDGTLAARTQRLLARLAAATGASRDGEVRLKWIAGHRGAIAGALDADYRWIDARLRARKAADDRRLRRELERNFEALVIGLNRSLAIPRAGRGGSAGPAIETTRVLMARTALELTDAFRAKLAVPAGVGDVRALHRARIAAKRLRYLLEPAAELGIAPPGFARAAREAIRPLTSLQDELGRVNDAHELSEWLRGIARRGKPRASAAGARVDGIRRRLASEAAEGFAAATLPAGRLHLERSLAAVEKAARSMVEAQTAR